MSQAFLTPNDYERSCTSHSLPVVARVLREVLAGTRPDAMLDVGCGYGGVGASLRAELGAAEVHGVDVDPDVIDEATGKGVRARCVDATVGLPYDDAFFDLVSCFGVLDYMTWFDGIICEMARVLRPNGVVAISLPNLASWHNRLALALGYQPRDVEICSMRTVGTAPYYTSSEPVGHIHAPTTRAFRELMALMGFREVCTVALRPANTRPAFGLQVLDAILGRFPSSARRFLYVGRRGGDPVTVRTEGWWASRGRVQ
jgi:SAM-dependent methyltransferase